MTNWPTNEDGSNKTIGQMTESERKEVFAASSTRVKSMDRATFEKIIAKAGS